MLLELSRVGEACSTALPPKEGTPMARYFEYLLDDARIPLDEASLPEEVSKREPDLYILIYEWPVEQRAHNFLRQVKERLHSGYRVVVAFNDDESEAGM
jgi:hypothetical protein